MDLTRIKSAVINQLTNTNGLYSLKIQNHIYGCFIIMEDIAMRAIDVSGTILSTPKFTFDSDTQFNEIGLRYGFAMDRNLSLDSFMPEYKQAWLEYFKDVDFAQDIADVDIIEDCLIEVVQANVIKEDAFFINALESGTLSQEWVEKVLNLLNHVDIAIEKTAIAIAIVETPIHRRRLSRTRRSKGIVLNKKLLGKTRRHK